jgi:hypothetical protein
MSMEAAQASNEKYMQCNDHVNATDCEYGSWRISSAQIHPAI